MTDPNEALDAIAAAEKALYDHVGYVQDWCVFPIDDCRDKFWYVDQDRNGGGEVHFADSEKELRDGEGNYYTNVIYTQRFLKRWVYRGEKLTAVLVDTHCDGNKFLRFFDNAKERPQSPL